MRVRMVRSEKTSFAFLPEEKERGGGGGERIIINVFYSVDFDVFKRVAFSYIA